MSKVQFSEFFSGKKRNKPSWIQLLGRFFSHGDQNCILSVQKNFMGVFFFKKWSFSGNLLCFFRSQTMSGKLYPHWPNFPANSQNFLPEKSCWRVICACIHWHFLTFWQNYFSTEERSYWGKKILSKKLNFSSFVDNDRKTLGSLG